MGKSNKKDQPKTNKPVQPSPKIGTPVRKNDKPAKASEKPGTQVKYTEGNN